MSNIHWQFQDFMIIYNTNTKIENNRKPLGKLPFFIVFL